MTPQQLLDLLRDNAAARAHACGPDDSSVIICLEMRKCVLTLAQSNEELARALSDALSTYRHDDTSVLVTAERQEAWEHVLKTHLLPPVK